MNINENEAFFKGEEGLDNPKDDGNYAYAYYGDPKFMGTGGPGYNGSSMIFIPSRDSARKQSENPKWLPIDSVMGGMLTGEKILEEIKNGRIEMNPFDPAKINPNSYNLTLNNTLLVYQDEVLDYKKQNPTNKILIPDNGLILYPGQLYLGSTNEETYTKYYIPMLNGRSSIGRLGITIHITAGFGDIGFRGKWTLEITVARKVKVYPNMEICQQCWFIPAGKTTIQYEGRYQNQDDVTASRSNLEKHIYSVDKEGVDI